MDDNTCPPGTDRYLTFPEAACSPWSRIIGICLIGSIVALVLLSKLHDRYLFGMNAGMPQ